MQSKAKTVSEYIASLPAERKAAMEAVRTVILENLDKGYQEGMTYGMIGYFVPHTIYPAGYHCDPRQPLPFAGLASQKQHISVYLMGMYCGCVGEQETELVRWFRDAWAKAGKKLDMGKACVRFKKLEDVPLDVLGEAIRRVPLKKFIDHYEQGLAAMSGGRSSPAKKTQGRANPVPPRMKAAKKVGKREPIKDHSR